jgi:hypothetical protein
LIKITNLVYSPLPPQKKESIYALIRKASYVYFNACPGRVARWFVFKPKIPIWVNFGGPCNGKCWYIL